MLKSAETVLVDFIGHRVVAGVVEVDNVANGATEKRQSKQHDLGGYVLKGWYILNDGTK